MDKLYEDRPEGCVIYQNNLDALLYMTDEQAGRAIKSAAIYFLRGEPVDDADQAVTTVIRYLRYDADKSLRRYRKVCERNRRNGQKHVRAGTEEPGEDSLPD